VVAGPVCGNVGRPQEYNIRLVLARLKARRHQRSPFRRPTPIHASSILDPSAHILPAAQGTKAAVNPITN
ncbi:MAG TPA: hypothetical protein VJX16_18940, partial [Terriglobales bacterium]|nr:hypothetical protein [Terriglobales bacterium]